MWGNDHCVGPRGSCLTKRLAGRGYGGVWLGHRCCRQLQAGGCGCVVKVDSDSTAESTLETCDRGAF